MKLLHAALIAILLAPCLSFAQTDSQRTPPAETPPQAPSAQTDSQQTPPPEASPQAPSPEAATAPAQAEGQTVGPTAFVVFAAARSHLGLVMTEDFNLGYNLTEHIGGDIGLPLFNVRTKFSLVTTHDWNWTTLMGQPYIDLRYTNTRAGARFTSVLTGTGPVSGSTRIFGTGRVGVDWFNHIEPERSFGGLKPFVNFGASNGTVDRYYMPRPYSMARPYETLGRMADGEAGLTYEIHHGLKVPGIPGIRRFTPHMSLRGIQIGASVYGLLPQGQQKIFSKLITPGSSVVGDEAKGRYFYGQFETIGPSSIARDNGYSGWIELARARSVDLQLSYTRSIHYANDTVGLMVKLDFTSLIRFVTGREQ